MASLLRALMPSGIKRLIPNGVKKHLPHDPEYFFGTMHYQRHNSRRLEHLASLELPLASRRVLEVGAGIGDHTSFFLDRGCEVTVTEARANNLRILRKRFPDTEVKMLDLDKPTSWDRTWDVAYCYGLLYHLRKPEAALRFLSEHAELLLLETCVTPGDRVELHLVDEHRESPTQALSGIGCRPTRPWVMKTLRKYFRYVYPTTTQPWHEEFPLNWNSIQTTGLTRSVFIASQKAIESTRLTTDLPSVQSRT